MMEELGGRSNVCVVAFCFLFLFFLLKASYFPSPSSSITSCFLPLLQHFSVINHLPCSFATGLTTSLSPVSPFRFPGTAGVWRSGPLVRGGLLGGEDTRRAPLLGPGALSGHLLRSTSRERLLPGPALLRKQVPAGADGAGQDRLRHPADARAGRGVGLQPQLLPHLHQVGHTGQPGLAHAAGAQGVPRVLHQSF